MSEIKDGGPAFPDGSQNQWGHPVSSGMTLRDYFAAKAMQSFMLVYGIKEGHLGDIDDDLLANAAYDTADAMLKKREETK